MKTFKEFTFIIEQLTAFGKLKYGSTSASASDRSVSSAVDKALANPGTSQSASERTGRTGVSGSGYIATGGSTSSGGLGGGRSTPSQTSSTRIPSSSEPRVATSTRSSSRFTATRPMGTSSGGGGSLLARGM